MINSSFKLPAELRFGRSEQPKPAVQENPFGLDRIDFGASQVHADHEAMACIGGKDNVKAAGDLMPLCKGAAQDVNSAGDLMPLCKGAAQDINSGRDLGPCMGSADVKSGILDAMGCFNIAGI